jgi:hypothetical protein
MSPRQSTQHAHAHNKKGGRETQLSFLGLDLVFLDGVAQILHDGAGVDRHVRAPLDLGAVVEHADQTQDDLWCVAVGFAVDVGT